MKYIINPEYAQYTSFIKEVPLIFESSGETMHTGRNLIKKFERGNISFVVKRFKKPHIINRFVYTTFRDSKAKRSYYNAFSLLEKGIGTPMPVAYMEEICFGLRDSYYISLEVKEAREMREFWWQPDIGDRMPILQSFSKLVADLHKKGIYHKDLSAGNAIFRIDGNEITFYLVDINRMTFTNNLPDEKKYENFKRLWLPDHTYREIAGLYADQMGLNKDETIRRICYYKDKFMKNRH